MRGGQVRGRGLKTGGVSRGQGAEPERPGWGGAAASARAGQTQARGGTSRRRLRLRLGVRLGVPSPTAAVAAGEAGTAGASKPRSVGLGLQIGPEQNPAGAPGLPAAQRSGPAPARPSAPEPPT